MDRASPGLLRALALPFLTTALTACRIEIAMPPGGKVETQSGTISCAASQTCIVDLLVRDAID